MDPLTLYVRYIRWGRRLRRKYRRGEVIEQWEWEKLWRLSRLYVESAWG